MLGRGQKNQRPEQYTCQVSVRTPILSILYSNTDADTSYFKNVLKY
jgi:hypothetical protein